MTFFSEMFGFSSLLILYMNSSTGLAFVIRRPVLSSIGDMYKPVELKRNSLLPTLWYSREILLDLDSIFLDFFVRRALATLCILGYVLG